MVYLQVLPTRVEYPWTLGEFADVETATLAHLGLSIVVNGCRA